MAKFVDLGGPHGLPEDKRIDLIGHRVVDHKEQVGFVVEDDAKADRYISKLKAKFPSIVVKERLRGPVKGTVSVILVPAPTESN